jgi:hypothetical protein
MEQKTKETLLKIAVLALAVVLIIGIILGAIGKYYYDNKLVDLQNTIASRDKTIETKDGLYEKLVIQTKNLEDLLNSKDKEIIALKEQLKDKDQELITATSLAVKWKKAYEALVAATQTTIPPSTPDGKERTKVSFQKDFGYIRVSGYTLTNPAEAFILVKQNRPLKLVVAVSQDKDKIWHTYATSSEENVGIDIQLASVNPYIFEPKWYERVAINAMLSMGVSGKLSALIGVGATIPINQFDVGPAVMLHMDGNGLDPMVGIFAAWHPFQR